jgi:hypothetical protein
MVLVDESVALAPGEQVAVDRERGKEGDGECECEASPEEQAVEACLHGTRHRNDSRVVDDLHDRDRQGVGGERDTDRPAKRYASTEERRQRQPVAEEEGEPDGQSDRRDRLPSECACDHEAEDLADGAPREAVQGRRQCETVDAAVLGLADENLLFEPHGGTNDIPL